MINFYDFEVFKYDWLVVIINDSARDTKIIINDKDELERYYNKHKKELWIGYNNTHYDDYILKAILCGFNPKEVNDFIIEQGQPGYRFSRLLNNIPLISFDTYLTGDRGLKTLEGFMGNDIEETSVPFDIDRKLSEDEIEEVVNYCIHDVEQTIEVFLHRQEEFSAANELIKKFDLPASAYGLTKARRVANILEGKHNKSRQDEFDFEIVDTLRLGKYEHLAKWYRKKENHDYSKHQLVMIGGIPHKLAWGGIHGSPGEITTNRNGRTFIKYHPYHKKGTFLLIDVTAYYPSLQLRYKFGYRNMRNIDNFEKIHNENLRLKKIDKKARLPYKIADNAISGQLKDSSSSLFDPRENNAITVNGQLLLVDLIDKLESHCKLVQSNTDGILVELKSLSDYEKIDDIVYEWEKRTGLSMEFSLYNEIFQKDVNNYVIISDDGSIKSIGGYTKKLSPVDYDLPILNKAVLDYMIKKIPVEKTIRECDDLIMFQKISKLSNKYEGAYHVTEKEEETKRGKKKVYDKIRRLNGTTFRIFASKDKNDGFVGKKKKDKDTIEHFAYTSDHSFIYNGVVKGKAVPDTLDKEWYVNEAKKRLIDYGVKYG